MASQSRPDDFQHTRVGVGAVITNSQGQIVVGQRIGSHGPDTWQLPGGHLDFGEHHFDCAERETCEETGLKVTPVKTLAITNDHFKEVNKHYVTIFVLCSMDDPEAQPQVKEEQKCKAWEWKSWDELRKMSENPNEKLFLPIVNLLKKAPDLSKLAAFD